MPIFPVYALNDRREQEQFARIMTQDQYTVFEILLASPNQCFQVWEPMYNDESSTLWALRGGTSACKLSSCVCLGR